MKRISSFLMLALVSGAAAAATTDIAQAPLLNISGTGAVKPNLMLLYDNSGSMTRAYTPDYIVDRICRSKAKMEGGNTRSCEAGDPPFNSPDFNKQYYNPKVLYTPPVRADGTFYPSLNAANTSNWTAVTTDGFGVNKQNLVGQSASTTNLVTGFPDLKWCESSSSSVCGFNTDTYTYPNNTLDVARDITTNPYYYTINVAEYCTDETMRTCVSTAIGAPAPVGYPVAAKVRWCDDDDLANCQAKYVGNFKYPRFGDPGRAPDWYGTITIKATPNANSATISSVSAVGAGGTFVITNNAVTASTGTNDLTKQTAVAKALAASIIAKAGLAEQYTACVRTPGSSGVPACSTFGITLSADNVVAVVPISCDAAAASKASCTAVTDGSRAGRDLVVSSGNSATALLSVSGTTSSSKDQVLQGLSLGSTQLFSSLTFPRNAGATTLVQKIVQKIGTGGAVRAYIGGTAAATSSQLCANASTSTVCLVAGVDREGQNITVGNLTNNGSSRVRFTTSAAASDGVPTATTPLGGSVFVRVDIVPSRTDYPKDAGRTDCAGATTCTYAEEMTNFANWYGYYKTRNQMMKTSVGHAFRPLTDNYNIGLVALSVAATYGATITPPKKFSGADRTEWYDRLYAMNGSSSTPIRLALHNIGMMFANRAPYEATPGEEVVKYPCQQNFTFVTTDGYWNGGAPSGVTNNDNVENAARFCLRSTGCVDPAPQSLNSLADIALYWYNGGSNGATTSLRPSLEDWSKPGLVPAGPGENTRLHMKTYALGLGVDGIMTYEPNYDKNPDPAKDFYKLITRVTSGCPWNNNGAYVWPNPQTGTIDGAAAIQSRVDDLWHAAINGHGKYFSASDPRQVVQGLAEALSNIEVKVGAAAAAATSTPNISQYDNDIFSATFTTVRWFGELSDRKIDPVTGEVGRTAVWNSSDLLGSRVSASDDSRKIKMLDVDAPVPTLKEFRYDEIIDNALERSWFENKCSSLAQCASLSSSDRDIVNDGANIVGWLRGRQQHADGALMRAYTKTDHTPAGQSAPLPIVLGDIASSKPAFQREPRKGFTDPDYTLFKEEHVDRTPAVFVAANDGMLHAFDTASGSELWAYVPRITMKKLHLLASTNYGTNHMFTTDGSPEVADVKTSRGWRSVLVAGLNAGGRGYYAIDVTEPDDPKALWELCADDQVCTGMHNVPELGLSFGNPQFGTYMHNGAERWVVFLTSGYNNVPGIDGVSAGDGKGYLFVVDVETGEVLKRLSTDSGTTGTPSGLAKITAITNNPNTDPRVTYVYGGDNLGQMWRFDFTGGTPGVLKMGDAGPLQPVTTRPDVTMCKIDDTNDSTPATQRVVAFGTGRLLDVPDVENEDVQSVYVLKDTGSGINASSWRQPSAMTRLALAKSSDASGDTYTITGTGDLGTTDGWFVDFDQNVGERVNLDPKIVAGGLNVVTNLPSSSSACSLGGTSNVYQLDVCTGRALENTIAGRTLSNTAAAVGFIIVRLPSGALKMITTTADGNTITSSVQPAATQAARRSGWRRVRD